MSGRYHPDAVRDLPDGRVHKSGRFAIAYQLSLPAERVGDDLVKIVMPGTPTQPFQNLTVRGHYLRRITGARLGFAYRKFFASAAIHCLNHLKHRMPLTVAAIQDRVLSA